MDIHSKVTKEEAIRQLEEVYHTKYDPNNPKFDVYNQLMACESIAEAEEKSKLNVYAKGESVLVSGNDNGTYKQEVNQELAKRKLKVISELQNFKYDTPPKRVAKLLEELFSGHNSNPKHWLYIAQNWNPRAINRVINYMLKVHERGEITINNPPAYFTHLIKYRKKRKSLSIPMVPVKT